jgi:hypothetical protein
MCRAQALGHFVKDFSFAFGVLNTCHPTSISKTLAFYTQPKATRLHLFALFQHVPTFFMWKNVENGHCGLEL